GCHDANSSLRIFLAGRPASGQCGSERTGPGCRGLKWRLQEPVIGATESLEIGWRMELGLDLILESRLDLVSGCRIGLIAHPSFVDGRLAHAGDLFWNQPQVNLTALFGPQHGIRAETQDNMIEWRSFSDKRTGLPAFSLYGETRKPSPDMLA